MSLLIKEIFKFSMRDTNAAQEYLFQKGASHKKTPF